MPELTCPVLVDGVQCARDLNEKAKYKAGIFNTIVYECDRGHLSRFLYQPVKNDQMRLSQAHRQHVLALL
jgi:hypothetical protein